MKIRLLLLCSGIFLLAGGWVSARAGLPPADSGKLWSPAYQPPTPFPHGLPEIRLRASDFQPHDMFGYAVDVDGAVLAAGAPGKDEAGQKAGGVYVFEQNGADWLETVRLTPNSLRDDDRLGMSVAVSGDTVISGAPYAATQTGGFAAGAVYVFVQEGSNWREQARLTAPDGRPFDLFGGALALDGDALVVGAQGADDPNGRNAGAAYVFHRVNGAWVEQARLSSPDAGADDFFGQSVAIQGNVVAVGAFGHDDPATGPNAGAVYLFHRQDGAWFYQSKLTAAHPVPEAQFGFSLAFAGNGAEPVWLAVGANQYSPEPVDPRYAMLPGRVEVFQRENEAWQPVAQFGPEKVGEWETGYFGAAVSMVLLGGQEIVATGSQQEGRYIHLFLRHKGGLALPIQAEQFQLNFGRSLAMGGTYLVVGSPWFSDRSTGLPVGAVYLYDLNGLK